MKDNTYGCDGLCGKRYDWDNEIIWVTSSVGFCQECYDKLVTDKLCPRCHTHVFVEPEKEIDYPYVCYDCEENFYEFEVEG